MDDDERLRTTPRPEPGPLATADTALCHTERLGQEAATGGQLRLRPLTHSPAPVSRFTLANCDCLSELIVCIYSIYCANLPDATLSLKLNTVFFGFCQIRYPVLTQSRNNALLHHVTNNFNVGVFLESSESAGCRLPMSLSGEVCRTLGSSLFLSGEK